MSRSFTVLLSSSSSPSPDDCLAPLRTITGPYGLVLPVKAVWVVPSMVMFWPRTGNWLRGWIVKTPLA